MDVPEYLEVKKIAHFVPVSAQALLDAGLPLPPGMEPPPPPKPLPRILRLRLAWAEFVWTARRRLGFWIADYSPDDEDW